jgi:glycosyltransferase involved in cell wall biosynthesis
MLQYEAEATIKAVGARVPVVLRAERGGRWGDCLWQIDARGGRRIKHACTAAASFVAPTPPVTRELEAAGYARPRIRQVLNGMVPSPPRTAESRNAARAALADAHAMLKLSEWATLALSTGRIERARGIEHLVAAWPAIARQWAGARLWLAGEAPERAALVRQTDSLGLSSRIVPVGVFDDVDALMAAADLFISPAPEGSPNGILEAMAAALPVVALDVPNNRWLVEDGRSGLLVPPGDVPGLAAAIARLAGDARLRSQFGAAGRERVAREFALERMVQEHLALFCDVRDSVSKK